MRGGVGLLAPSYVVGEIEGDVDTLSNKVDVLNEFAMPDVKELWGWDTYRKSDRSAVALACDSVRATLDKAGLQPTQVDALVLCCNGGFNYHAQNRFLGELTTTLGLGYTFVSWVGGAGCASLFSAAKLANALVESGTSRTVLVVTVDKIERDVERFQRYGVLSDGSCSFVVLRSDQADYSIRAVKVMSCPSSLQNGGANFQEKCQLIYSVFDELKREGLAELAKTTAFFGSNIFIPIQEIELSVMPVDGLLAYQGNTARYGHCYAADPIINLVDFYSQPENAGVSTSMLASTAHGHFGLIMLQKR